MNKKELVGIIIVILMMIILLFVGVYIYLSKENEECKKRDLSSGCMGQERGCFDDCNKLQMEYFRYDNGGFASDECWCKINNDVKQIW